MVSRATKRRTVRQYLSSKLYIRVVLLLLLLLLLSVCLVSSLVHRRRDIRLDPYFITSITYVTLSLTDLGRKELYYRRRVPFCNAYTNTHTPRFAWINRHVRVIKLLQLAPGRSEKNGPVQVGCYRAAIVRGAYRMYYRQRMHGDMLDGQGVVGRCMCQ